MKDRVMRYTVAGVFVLLLLGLTVSRVQLWAVGRALAEVTTERDSIAADAATERQRANGWEVKFGEEENLRELMEEEKDTALAALSRDYRASRIRVQSLTELLASASGTIESTGTQVDTVEVEILCEGAWEGRADDDILSGFWRFTLPSATHVLNYTAMISGELVQGVTGDGRWVFSARGLHPQVELKIPSVYVDPPKPMIVYKTRWGRLVLSNVIAFGSGRASCAVRSP